ncbi:hypothetical protein [Burkholderia sp. BC1]|uniref:hypothetical protein n=1 Tax=Burkholderia sp. BC1 TaxID=1095370 RepID=UPI004044845E
MMFVNRKWIPSALAAAAFVAGMVGAWYWYRSAKVDVKRVELDPADPFDPLEFEPVELDQKQLWMHVRQMNATEAIWTAQLEANREMGRLNKIAAGLTAAAVALGTAGTLWSTLFGPP